MVKQAFNDSTNAINKANWGPNPALKKQWYNQYSYYPKDAGFMLTTTASSSAFGKSCNKLAAKEAISMQISYGDHALVLMIYAQQSNLWSP